MTKTDLTDRRKTGMLIEHLFVFSGKEGSFYIDAALYRAQKDGLSGVIYYYGTEEKTAEEGAEAGEEAEE